MYNFRKRNLSGRIPGHGAPKASLKHWLHTLGKNDPGTLGLCLPLPCILWPSATHSKLAPPTTPPLAPVPWVSGT